MRRAGLRCICTVIACAFAACDGGTDAHRDGGVSDGGDAALGFAVAPPDIPWLADGVPPIGIVPCPEGWREVADASGVATCDPYPEGGSASCAFGEGHFPGEPACRPIGEPCPSGEYAASLPAASSVVYVDASAAPGGDGSLAAPHAALTAVPWSSLAAGTTVALAKGTYEGTLPLRAGVDVVGACVAETILTGLAAPVMAVVTVTTAGEPALVRNVAIVDAPEIGAFVDAGRELTLEGVLVDRAHGVGAATIDGATLTLRDVVVQATQSAGTLSGRGIVVERGGHLDASRALVAQNREAGVSGEGAGTDAVLTDVVVRDTRPRADGEFGRGIEIRDAARLEASRALIERNHSSGVLAGGVGTDLALTDVVVLDTRPDAIDGRFGSGITVQEGAHLEASRVLVAQNRTAGVFAAGAQTELMLEDFVIRDTQPQTSHGLEGDGISVFDGARVALSRAFVVQNHAFGVSGDGVGSTIVLSDAVVRETLARGIGAQTGAYVEASRVLLAQNREFGVFAVGTGTEVVLTDAVVRETRSLASDGTFGRGLSVQDGVQLRASRVRVEDNREIGVFGVGIGTALVLVDVEVRDTSGRERDLEGGYGVSVQEGARISGERVVIDGAREMGLGATVGAAVELTDVSIARVERSECACDRVFGHGVVAASGVVRLTRFAVREVATCGLFLAPASPSTSDITSLDVESGVVQGAEIGACVQVDGYDLMRLSRDVLYVDNGTNLESTMLPVPAPVDGL